MAANQAQLALASDCGPQPETLGERDQRAPDERPFRQDPGHSTHHDLVAFVRGIFTGEDRVERGSRGLGNVEEGDQGVRNTLRVAALRMVGLHLTFFLDPRQFSANNLASAAVGMCKVFAGQVGESLAQSRARFWARTGLDEKRWR